jgi:hypothetical protein
MSWSCCTHTGVPSILPSLHVNLVRSKMGIFVGGDGEVEQQTCDSSSAFVVLGCDSCSCAACTVASGGRLRLPALRPRKPHDLLRAEAVARVSPQLLCGRCSSPLDATSRMKRWLPHARRDEVRCPSDNQLKQHLQTVSANQMKL